MNICVCHSSSSPLPETLSDSVTEFTNAASFLSSLEEFCPVYVMIDPDCFTHEQLAELKRLHPTLPVAILSSQITPAQYEAVNLLSPFRMIEPTSLQTDSLSVLRSATFAACSIRMDLLRQLINMILLSEVRQNRSLAAWQDHCADYRMISSHMRALAIRSCYLVCICSSACLSAEQEQCVMDFAAQTPSVLFGFRHQDDIALLFTQPDHDVLSSLLGCLKGTRPEQKYGIGISERITASSPEQFTSCFLQAKLATEDNFYREAEILSYTESLFTTEQDYTTLIYYEKELTNAILMGHSEDALLTLLQGYIDYFRRQRLLPSIVCDSVYRFLNSLDRVFKFIDPLCSIDLTFITPEQINAYGTLDALHTVLAKMLLDFLRSGEHYAQTPERLIHEIASYIDDHLEQPITLSTIEQEFYVNKFVFCRQFKKYTGMNFSRYIRDGRLRRAKDLLTNTDMKIYELSDRLGFQDESYFGQVFKKEFGISPTAYRLASRTPTLPDTR